MKRKMGSERRRISKHGIILIGIALLILCAFIGSWTTSPVKAVQSEPTLVDVEISAIDTTTPVHKSTFKWGEPLQVWYKIKNPLDIEIDVLLQCQMRDPVTEAILVPDQVVRLHPGTDWYSLTAFAPSHAGKTGVTWEIYAPDWKKKYDQIWKEEYLTVEKGELPEEPTVKKSTTLIVLPSSIAIESGKNSYFSAELTADGVGELEYKTINWTVEKGTLSSGSTVMGEGILYRAPNYETVDTVTASFAGSEGYQESKDSASINVKANFKTISVETEWWETVRPEEPQFIITIYNKGNREFTITKVVLSGIEVWRGRFTVGAHSKEELEISDISSVFERCLLNNLNLVYIENATSNPFAHNIIITNNSSFSYKDGHTTVNAYIGLIEEKLTPLNALLQFLTEQWTDISHFIRRAIAGD